jgi:hypothetical protein
MNLTSKALMPKGISLDAQILLAYKSVFVISPLHISLLTKGFKDQSM